MWWCCVLYYYNNYYAEAELPRQYCNRAVCLLQAFLVARWKPSAKTSNTSWTRYLLRSELKKFGSKASLVSYGVICLPWLRGWRSGLYWRQNFPHLTAWKLVGSICTTDSTAGPEKLRQKAMSKSTAISLVCWYCSPARDGTKPGLWTHGLDRGLDHGPKYGLKYGPKFCDLHVPPLWRGLALETKPKTLKTFA